MKPGLARRSQESQGSSSALELLDGALLRLGNRPRDLPARAVPVDPRPNELERLSELLPELRGRSTLENRNALAPRRELLLERDARTRLLVVARRPAVTRCHNDEGVTAPVGVTDRGDLEEGEEPSLQVCKLGKEALAEGLARRAARALHRRRRSPCVSPPLPFPMDRTRGSARVVCVTPGW